MLALVRRDLGKTILDIEDPFKEAWFLTESPEDINNADDCDLIFLDHKDDAIEAIEEQAEGFVTKNDYNWFKVYECPVITATWKHDPVTNINHITNAEAIASLAKEHSKILVQHVGQSVLRDFYKYGCIIGPYIPNAGVRELTYNPKKAKSLLKSVNIRQQNKINKGKIDTKEIRCMNHAINSALYHSYTGFIKIGITFGADRLTAIKQFSDFMKLALTLKLGHKIKNDIRWQKGWSYLKQFINFPEEEKELMETLIKYAKSINRSRK